MHPVPKQPQDSIHELHEGLQIDVERQGRQHRLPPGHRRSHQSFHRSGSSHPQSPQQLVHPMRHHSRLQQRPHSRPPPCLHTHWHSPPQRRPCHQARRSPQRCRLDVVEANVDEVSQEWHLLPIAHRFCLYSLGQTSSTRILPPCSLPGWCNEFEPSAAARRSNLISAAKAIH